jgi:lipid II:glycine glycyltransferase (peptidoglycan interpeptide bridge formation enzyme)
LGIAPADQPKHSLAGVTQFKTRFGGERIHYHGAQLMVIRPFWWGVYRVAKKFF